MPGDNIQALLKYEPGQRVIKVKPLILPKKKEQRSTKHVQNDLGYRPLIHLLGRTYPYNRAKDFRLSDWLLILKKCSDRKRSQHHPVDK